MKRLTQLFASCLFTIGLLATHAPSMANENYPNRPIRIIIPFGPGGTTDIVARALSEGLKQDLGQPIVIENKPGANGILAIHELARSGADGYTFMLGNVGTNALAPILYADKLSFSYERDIVPVMRIADVPGILVATTKNFVPKTVSEFIAYAKANPGKVNYGTPGIANYTNYDMALFAQRAGGLVVTAVPNKAGASGVINDLLSGTVQVAFLNAASTMPHVLAGKLKALAVVNHKRLSDLPNVPTMAEAGFPTVGTIAWQGLFASGEVSTEILEKVRKATEASLQTASVQKLLKRQGFNIVPTHSLDEAKSWLRADLKVWRSGVDELKLKAN